MTGIETDPHPFPSLILDPFNHGTEMLKAVTQRSPLAGRGLQKNFQASPLRPQQTIHTLYEYLDSPFSPRASVRPRVRHEGKDPQGLTALHLRLESRHGLTA